METRLADRLANLLFLPARLMRKAIPKPVRDHLEDRLFYAIFQVTRVTNDAYPRRDEAPEAPPVSPPSSRSAPAAERPRSSPRR